MRGLVIPRRLVVVSRCRFGWWAATARASPVAQLPLTWNAASSLVNNVTVAKLDPRRFETVLDPNQGGRFVRRLEHAADQLAGRRLWHLNSTEQGGGVAELPQEHRIPRSAPIVVQVSRWDRLKDPWGVLQGFADHVADDLDATWSWLVRRPTRCTTIPKARYWRRCRKGGPAFPAPRAPGTRASRRAF
jgi:hypothetical protein